MYIIMRTFFRYFILWAILLVTLSLIQVSLDLLKDSLNNWVVAAGVLFFFSAILSVITMIISEVGYWLNQQFSKDKNDEP